MRKLITLLLCFIAFKASAQVIVSQPQIFQKYIRVKGSLFADSTVLLSDTSTNKVAPLNFINQYFQKKGSSAGGVTSVALSLPSIFSVSGSPVTSSGTLGATLQAQAPLTFLAAPFNGASGGTPLFRAMAINDLPATGTPSSTTYLRGDGTWATPSGSSGITALTGDVTASGTGSVAATVAQINGITKNYYDPTSSIQTQLNGKQASLGYTAENIANKETSVTGSSSLYPTGLAVQNYVTGLGYLTSSTAASTYLPIANPAATGSFTLGTLGYTGTNVLASFQSSVNAFNQLIVQNSNSGASASSDVVVNNNNSTNSTFYGDFGMNSSGFTGSGALNAANNVYLTSTSSDLAIGTTTANGIHFVVNSGATDALTIGSTGAITAPAFGTGLIHSSSGGLFSSSAVSLTADVSGILPVANGGTGTASPGIVAGTNVTVTGTWPNQTVNSTAAGATYANPTATAGTSFVNGVATTAMRSDAAPKVDSTVFTTKALISTYLTKAQTVASYVPYTGATANVAIGGFQFASQSGSASANLSYNGLVLSNSTGGGTSNTESQTNISFVNNSNTVYNLQTNTSGTPNAITGNANAFQQNGIAVTSTDDILAQNTTASTSGVPNQWSPRLRFNTHVWNTTATAADNQLDFIEEIKTTSGTAPVGKLTSSGRESVSGSGSYTSLGSVDNSGNWLFTGTLNTLYVGHGLANDVNSIAVGSGVAASSGTGSTTFGMNAQPNDGGAQNTAIGGYTLGQVISGGNNTALGYGAGYGETTINNGTFIGEGAAPTVNSLSNVTALGYGATVGTSNQMVFGNTSVTSNVFHGTIQYTGYTVATLPTAGTAGRFAYVTDATAPTFLGVLVGGGSTVTPVFDNGTAWVSY